ncbi:AT-hook motif nuclear-localized protein 22-like [Forsythia ovata]|uniref:AT-hook motif nuclear-localized protein 22-like n=1 Tax=Forsythia ovata TaxID=205694 RepID=A0ABD1S790_9LAMI
MDQLTAQGRSLPPPFHARDLQLHHHPFQHRQQNLEDEQSKNSNINCSLKQDRDKNYSGSTTAAEEEELLPATTFSRLIICAEGPTESTGSVTYTGVRPFRLG